MKHITTLIFAVLFFTLGLSAQSLKVGDEAPYFEQTMLDSSIFKLSDLKGKVVLIDFWASWCAPCRRENKNLAEVYKKYKDKKFDNGNGFEIVSVSLDSKKASWKKAIKADGLEWYYHVSDLKGYMNATAQKYKIKSIPSSYLIDENGIILEINLRGEDIDKKLKKLKKGFF